MKKRHGMNALFIGDIVGKGGRRAVNALVPQLRQEYGCCFCVANGENMAGGGGITRKCIREIEPSGIDVITGGDHIWDQREFPAEADGLHNVLRPANVNPVQPGRGYGVFPLPTGGSMAVVCLVGRVFMNSLADCPFQAADRILAELRGRTPHIIVDFHAEATSEKTAMGRYLDSRVTAVIGTHTHVCTADEQVFPGGTAFQCDAGMVGSRQSILGRAIDPVLKRFVTGMPARFTVVEDKIRLHGAVVSFGSNGRATAIQRIERDFP